MHGVADVYVYGFYCIDVEDDKIVWILVPMKQVFTSEWFVDRVSLMK